MRIRPAEGRGIRHLPLGGSRRAGFTLIELLVVVAIIALLIAILLPSLSRARAQTRTTLCASRMAQMCTALLLYADDYDETPPFMGRGWEDADDVWQDPLIWPSFPGQTLTVRDWKYLEDWLMPNMPDYWALPEDGWPDYARVRNGRLFSYTRFEELYRCPEFERVVDSRKSQNVFNYTRTLLGRKWYHINDPEGQEGSHWFFGNWAGAPGPIMKLGQVYAPARLEILFDERWSHHCAAPAEQLIPPTAAGEGLLKDQLVGQWMVADPLFELLADEFGQYHGQPVPSELAPPEFNVPAVKRGSLVYYDGHVDLGRDPLPDRNLDPSLGISGAIELGTKFLEWALGHVHAQRGATDVAVNSPIQF